ncbi:MAG: hypothetical protein HYR74_03445 [Candidatus Eisenbacteria bacterium]|nr:hypothetical protein [Candidatus Eisenbacteria bacterium]
MKKTLLITGALLALAASTAMAGGVNLSWGDCGLAGTQNKAFACNSNTAAPNIMVVSYEPNVGVPDMVGNDVAVDLQTASATLDQWWQMFNAGSCRATSLSSSADFTAGPFTCTDFWLGLASGGIGSYTVNVNRARILIFWAVPGASAGPVSPGTEYYSCKVTVNNAKSVGTGSCAGCASAVCVVANIVQCDGNAGGNDFEKIQNPRDRNFVTWQGGLVTGGCPGATPTQSRTWGQLKSLYR